MSTYYLTPEDSLAYEHAWYQADVEREVLEHVRTTAPHAFIAVFLADKRIAFLMNDGEILDL